MANTKITQEILSAIRMRRDTEALSYEDMGNLVGVNKSSIGKWFSGETQMLRREVWQKLYPCIQKYLPSNFNPLENSGAVVVNYGGTNYGNAISNYTMSVVLKKIIDSENLTAEEKIKFIKVLQED